jgi:AraC-like DNA-binding protein
MATILADALSDGLERSCAPGDWWRRRALGHGLELLHARFRGQGFTRHRHDSYAIGVTDFGVQTFDYRGRVERRLRGEVVVLHPDELHDGRAGDERGFGYHLVYGEPARIAEAVRALTGRPSPLPFVPNQVTHSPLLADAVRAAFAEPDEPLAADALVDAIARGLVQASSLPMEASRHVDQTALARVRSYLDDQPGVVRSSDLEAVSGLSRYELARQFRAAFGTSPYRYSVLRRLDLARAALARHVPLAQVAADAGFADQAHFTRTFKAAFGMPPGRYAALARFEPAR